MNFKCVEDIMTYFKLVFQFSPGKTKKNLLSIKSLTPKYGADTATIGETTTVEHFNYVHKNI
jgi:hypothetical protein